MKWEMEIEEIEAVLEKIWDLHDKLSDAIHAISRTHFLNSIKSLRKSNDAFFSGNYERSKSRNEGNEQKNGFVFVKDFRGDDDAAFTEAKSLNAIRTALENLEDQLEFFHTLQSQQRAERDAAIARLEQSRIVLAMRLADHRGKKYHVIEEALAFVGDVHDASRFVSPENLFESPGSQSGENLESHVGKRPNMVTQILVSSFNLIKKIFRSEPMGGVLGNAAIFAVSMLTLLHLHQVAFRNNASIELQQMQDESLYGKRNSKKSSWPEGSSAGGHGSHLDVLQARG